MDTILAGKFDALDKALSRLAEAKRELDEAWKQEFSDLLRLAAQLRMGAELASPKNPCRPASCHPDIETRHAVVDRMKETLRAS